MLASRPDLPARRPDLPARRRWRLAGPLVGALAAALVLAGCGGPPHVDAPVITVVTSVYPLAQAVSEVGGSQVRVIDLARAGVDPRTTNLSAAQLRQIQTAGLIVDVGGGFQPAVEAAAKTARRQLSLLPAIGGTNPYIWLDPALMKRVAPLLAAALTRAEPKAKTVFSSGSEDLVSTASSLDIDFENSLEVCPIETFATSDDAFATMAHQYGLNDHAVGHDAQPSGAVVRAAIEELKSTQATAAFAEPFVNQLVVRSAAQGAGVQLKTLNTLMTPPASGGRAEVSYSNQMEINLKTLTDALQCPTDQS